MWGSHFKPKMKYITAIEICTLPLKYQVYGFQWDVSNITHDHLCTSFGIKTYQINPAIFSTKDHIYINPGVYGPKL